LKFLITIETKDKDHTKLLAAAPCSVWYEVL